MASITPKVSADPSRLQTSLKVGRGGSLSVRYHPYATTHMYSRFDKLARKIVGQVEKLFQAVMKGDLESLQKFLTDKAILNCQNEYGNTILMVAAASPYSHIVEVLLKKGADPKVKNHEGRDALFFAERDKHVKTIAMLFSHRIYHTPGATRGKSILMAAAEGGHTSSVSLLLATNRCRFNDKDEAGMTALMYAALGGHTETVGVLLQAGVYIDQEDRQGRTALMIAAHEGHQLVVQRLLDYQRVGPVWAQGHGWVERSIGVTVDAVDSGGWTALMYASLGGHIDIAKALVAAKANINQQKEKERTTALMIAAGKGCRPMVFMLLEKGADHNLRDQRGCNAAMHAARNGHEPLLKFFIHLLGGFDSLTLVDRVMLLAEAAAGGHTLLVKKLVDAGIGVNLPDVYGFTALMMAAHSGRTETVRLLLRLEADVNAVSDSGDTALICAAKGQGDQTIATLLLSSRAQLEARNNSGRTPLMAAADNGNSKMVRALLENIAQIDAEDDEGETAFTLAAGGSHVEVMRLLAAFRADVNHQNRGGNVALKYAAINGRTEVVQVLLELEANINAPDTEGRTALANVIAKIKEPLDIEEDDEMIDGQDTSFEEFIHTSTIRLLLQSGARVDASILEMLDSSLLGITALLLENESTPRHAQDKSGRTLLARSIISNQPDEYIALLAKWIDSSLVDTDGLTALDHALKMNKPKVVEILARNFARLPAGFESLEKYMEKRNLHLTDQVDAAGKRIPFTFDQIKKLSAAYQSGRTASIKSAEAVLVPTYLGEHSISTKEDLETGKTQPTKMMIDAPIMEIIAAYVGGYAFPDAPRT